MKDDAKHLETILPLTGEFNLGVSYRRNTVDFYIELMVQKSQALIEPINEAFAHAIRDFLHDEVDRHLKGF